jgi:hypothetical protein
MIKQSVYSFVLSLLYLLFLGNANLYAYTSINETVSSCCEAEESSCCGSCSSEESSDSDSDCCQGNGCCDWQETRIPSSIFHAESSQELSEKKYSEEKLSQKFNKESFYTLNFYFATIVKNQPDCHPKRELIADRHSRFSIWRC